ncbi:MAG: alpha/beta fold hydrolase, partial [Mariprofundaceae bacterium]
DSSTCAGAEGDRMSLPMIFLHGWGQSKQVWHRQMEAFPEALFLNLPGHGDTAEDSNWIEAVGNQLPDSPSMIVGWSMGGMVAMQLALQYPEKIAGLVLVSTTPLFCQQEGWESGCNSELFEAFENGVQSNSAKTMSRFFAMMLHGNELSRSEYNQIAREAIDRSTPPSITTLKTGLEYLAKTDLRKALGKLNQPTFIVHGSDDAIIPVAAGQFLAEHIPDSQWHIFEQCGHAPFLTHTNEFNELAERWCLTI